MKLLVEETTSRSGAQSRKSDSHYKQYWGHGWRSDEGNPNPNPSTDQCGPGSRFHLRRLLARLRLCWQKVFIPLLRLWPPTKHQPISEGKITLHIAECTYAQVEFLWALRLRCKGCYPCRWLP